MHVETIARHRTEGRGAVPDLREVLAALQAGWRSQAACAGSPIGFFPAKAGRTDQTGSAAFLAPLLVCASCPVRRSCLAEALAPHAYNHEDTARPTTADLRGVWGGGTEAERRAVRHLPVTDAVAILEDGLEARLAERVAAWRRGMQKRKSRSGRDRAVERLLGETVPVVARFEQGGRGGPGRGHAGPIATYAAAHGVSRSTAWRRLRAS